MKKKFIGLDDRGYVTGEPTQFVEVQDEPTMNQIPNIEEEYTSHEALKEWEKEKDQYNLTQNIVTLLGIHGMHCKFYEYQNASHITKAFEDLFHQQLQKAREERVDFEAIKWGYMKLLGFGLQNTTAENALMMDRLRDFYQE